MFINTKTQEVLQYYQLQQQPGFEGVGWPYDQTVSGIDEIIAENGYARFQETPAPAVDENHIAEIGGAVLVDGQWQREWKVREKTDADRQAEYELALEGVRMARAAEYPPIGDQLDAIMKWLATETEFNVPTELKSLAMKCMSVKAKHPKPTEE